MRAFLSLVALLTVACGGAIIEKKIISIPVDQNGIARVVNERGENLGNVEILFHFNSIGGKSVTWKNGNDSAVGLKITKTDEPGIDVLSDAWTGAGDSGSRSGINFEHGWPLTVTVAHYQPGLGSAIEALIQGLTSDPDFLDNVEQTWIKSRDTAEFQLQ